MSSTTAAVPRASCWLRLLVGIAVVAMVAVVQGTGARASTPVRQTVEVFGDSLSTQASPYLERDFSSETLVDETHVFPGTSVCDWLPAIRKLTSKDAPDVVVLQFIGNVSACDHAVTAPAALASAYATDLTAAITDLRADGVADVVVDEGPRTDCTAFAYCAAQPDLRAAFVRVVDSFDAPGVVYARLADREVESPRGRYTKWLTCLPEEVRSRLCTRGSKVQVRAPDGIHFRPVPHVVDGDEMLYDSGAYRFATGFAEVIWQLDPAARPRSCTTVP
jgi:hypothetical protein